MKNRVLLRPIILFPALFILIYLSGCSTLPQKSIFQPNETSLQVIHDILDKNYQKFHTLQGRGKLVVQSPRQSFSGNAVVNMKKPDSIYIRIEAVLGLDVGLVFADRSRFLIYSPIENLAYVGDAGDTLRLESILGFDLTFQEMFQSMSGLAFLKNMTSAKVQADEQEMHIFGIADSIFYDYTLDRQFGLISRLETKDFNGRTLRIEEYKRFVTIAGVRIPQMVRLLRPYEKESLTIFYEQLIINRPVPKKNFHIRLPADVLKIRL